MTPLASIAALRKEVAQGGHLSRDEKAELFEALAYVRAVIGMANDAGHDTTIQLTGDDICCLLRPVEAHLARVLRPRFLCPRVQ